MNQVLLELLQRIPGTHSDDFNFTHLILHAAVDAVVLSEAVNEGPKTHALNMP